MFSIYFSFKLCNSGCYKTKKVSKDRPINASDRSLQNIKEGRGISLGNVIGKNRSTNYEFSTSNPLWRASLETIDFMPLTTVDYSGGIIITDWYKDAAGSNDSIKITVRFYLTKFSQIV